jgi:hypothetical protein
VEGPQCSSDKQRKDKMTPRERVACEAAHRRTMHRGTGGQRPGCAGKKGPWWEAYKCVCVFLQRERSKETTRALAENSQIKATLQVGPKVGANGEQCWTRAVRTKAWINGIEKGERRSNLKEI